MQSAISRRQDKLRNDEFERRGEWRVTRRLDDECNVQCRQSGSCYHVFKAQGMNRFTTEKAAARTVMGLQPAYAVKLTINFSGIKQMIACKIQRHLL